MKNITVLVVGAPMAVATIAAHCRTTGMEFVAVDKLPEPDPYRSPWFDESNSISLLKAFDHSAAKAEIKTMNTSGPIKKRGKGKIHNHFYNGRRK